ncbi:hypothetical protein [Mycolicibacterium sp.]|uniref:hypothetical protein n=1 Tax=Mycolicibacterium sp. TaxID=2320850 RepID=UPI003D0BF931
MNYGGGQRELVGALGVYERVGLTAHFVADACGVGLSHRDDLVVTAWFGMTTPAFRHCVTAEFEHDDNSAGTARADPAAWWSRDLNPSS